MTIVDFVLVATSIFSNFVYKYSANIMCSCVCEIAVIQLCLCINHLVGLHNFGSVNIRPIHYRITQCYMIL